jgi:hypothetical protein
MTEQGLGCYVYCVTAREESPPLEGVPGVDPAFEVEVLEHGPLSAVMSRVPLDEFGAEPLKRNLEDLAWLERAARGHQSVLDGALASDAVVPLRLCTIFADDGQVRDMLEREGEVLLEALERVRGHAEWSVKLLADAHAIEAAARERGLPPAMSSEATGGEEPPGRAYLTRKKLDRALRDEVRAISQSAAEETHSRLKQQATAATLLPAQNPEVSGRKGDMVLNGAYLVERDRAVEFASVAQELADRHREQGLVLEWTGPWAPYNFTKAVDVQR